MKREKRVFSIREVLESWLSNNRTIAYRIKTEQAVLFWDRITDEYVSAHSAAVSIKEGTLVVNTDSSALANELALREDSLKEEMNRRLDGPVVKKIVFRCGFVKQKDDTASMNEKSAKRPGIADMKRVDRTVEDIRGQELKNELKKLFISSLKWGRKDDF
ncbi:MAG: DUF721 domain-containing protein [Spirochaetes bacterium]|nr:DUF721 domain-containing protein [Spirochaetota bacterium]